MPSAADRRTGLYGLAAAGVLGLDLLTKQSVESAIRPGESLPVLGQWVQLRLVYNPGAAFGLHLGDGSRWLFLLVAAVAVVVLTGLAWRTASPERHRLVAMGLVAGGAAGNLVDRIRSPAGVVDFLDLGIGSLRWPTFNVADIGVTCGAIALAVSFWLEDARRDRVRATG